MNKKQFAAVFLSKLRTDLEKLKSEKKFSVSNTIQSVLLNGPKHPTIPQSESPTSQMSSQQDDKTRLEGIVF